MTHSRRRLAYYAAVIVGAVVVHQSFFASWVGGAVTDFLRRNSEAYALMVLVPAYWDLFAPQGDPRRRGLVAPWGSRPNDLAGQVAWFGFLGVGVVLLQTGIPEALGVDLPQAVITLGEAFVAAIVISLYLGWSRGLGTWAKTWAEGQPMVSPWARTIYYVLVLGLTVAIYQSWFFDLFGKTAVDWLQVNAEAYAAALVIPLYFDLVAASRRPIVRIVWYVGLLVAPVAIQSGALDPLLGAALVGWLERTTEVFLAAFVISGYFDVVRSPWPVHHSHHHKRT